MYLTKELTIGEIENLHEGEIVYVKDKSDEIFNEEFVECKIERCDNRLIASSTKMNSFFWTLSEFFVLDPDIKIYKGEPEITKDKNVTQDFIDLKEKSAVNLDELDLEIGELRIRKNQNVYELSECEIERLRIGEKVYLDSNDWLKLKEFSVSSFEGGKTLTPLDTNDNVTFAINFLLSNREKYSVWKRKESLEPIKDNKELDSSLIDKALLEYYKLENEFLKKQLLEALKALQKR